MIKLFSLQFPSFLLQPQTNWTERGQCFCLLEWTVLFFLLNHKGCVLCMFLVWLIVQDLCVLFFRSLMYVISYFWIIIRSELCLLKISRTVNCVCSCFAAVNYVFFTSEPYKKCTVYFGLSWSEGVNCVFLLVRVKCVSLFFRVNCVFLHVGVNCVFFLVGVNCVFSCLLEWNVCPCSLELTVCSCLLEWTVCSCLLVWIMCSCLLEWTVCSCLLKLTACSCLLEWTGCAWPKNHHTKYIYFMYF